MRTKLLLISILFSFLFNTCYAEKVSNKMENGKVSSFNYKSGKTLTDKSITVYYYIPKTLKAEMPIQYIMHGTNRNGEDYLLSWKDFADKYGMMIVAPTFSLDQFPVSHYQEGNVVNEKGEYNDADNTIYNLLDEVYEYIIRNGKLKQNGYNIFGHSAGGQFVHRFFIFHDSPYVKIGIAANPGWYTTLDDGIDYPYGIKNYSSKRRNINNGKECVKRAFSKQLVILLGTADTLRSKNLRMTPEADAQGMTRLERGKYFYRLSQSIAIENNFDINWKLEFVEGSGHSYKDMAPKASRIFYGE